MSAVRYDMEYFRRFKWYHFEAFGLHALVEGMSDVLQRVLVTFEAMSRRDDGMRLKEKFWERFRIIRLDPRWFFCTRDPDR